MGFRQPLFRWQRGVADQAVGPEVHYVDLQLVVCRFQCGGNLHTVRWGPGNAEVLAIKAHRSQVRQLTQVQPQAGIHPTTVGKVEGHLVRRLTGEVLDQRIVVIGPTDQGVKRHRLGRTPLGIKLNLPGAVQLLDTGLFGEGIAHVAENALRCRLLKDGSSAEFVGEMKSRGAIGNTGSSSLFDF